MATTAQLSALGSDASWRLRIKGLMFQIAAQVYSEDPGTTSHTARVNFAYKVVSTPGLPESYAAWFTTRTNVTGTNITYNFADGQIGSDATDAALLSQIATDWNFLAGV